MTRLQLFVSKPSGLVLTAEKRGEIFRNTFNVLYAVQTLRLFSFVWLYWFAQKYEYLLLRPKDIFFYEHALPRFLMPSLPSQPVVYTLVGLVVVCNLYQLLRVRTQVLLQLAVALGILWLNLVLWGYGFLSHINHLFVLANLFLVFIPVSRKALLNPSVYLHQSINWFYAGLLFTYTLAGLWKVPSLAYKLIFAPDYIHWLHPKAALVNSIVSHRNLDLDFTLTLLFTSFPLLWQVGFLVMVYLQVSSVFGAFRLSFRPWVGLFLLVFHTLNMLVFKVYFEVTSITILCLFMPYDLLLRKALSRDVSSEQARTPMLATSFERFRSRLGKRAFYLAGPLYLPGLRSLAKLMHRVYSRP